MASIADWVWGLLGPVDPSFRALSGRLKFTVRRHKFNKDSLSLGWVTDRRGSKIERVLDAEAPNRRADQLSLFRVSVLVSEIASSLFIKCSMQRLRIAAQCGPGLRSDAYSPQPQANVAHISQSRPDSGLGFQVKVLKTLEVVPYLSHNPFT